jgi:hypothetical protein
VEEICWPFVGLCSILPGPKMSSDGHIEPVSSSWRTSAWPAVVRPILDKERDGAKTRSKSGVELTVHTMQPSQSYCSWAASHNYLDVVAFHSCTRQRNVFRVANLKINHENPSASSMEVCSLIPIPIHLGFHLLLQLLFVELRFQSRYSTFSGEFHSNQVFAPLTALVVNSSLYLRNIYRL